MNYYKVREIHRKKALHFTFSLGLPTEVLMLDWFIKLGLPNKTFDLLS
jgi:hypothetical protein